MKLRHFFLPHPKTHKKAHLISAKALLIYLLLFVGLRVALWQTPQKFPGVLGISSNIDPQQVISLTNKERAKLGLAVVKENNELDLAAYNKALNMFKEDYWAHYAPSGKSPWDFIKSAGYQFSYAGENLARNFYTPEEVVQAWMNSPSHRDNLLSSRYQEIGVAVVQGTLKGEQTTLVVQEFASPNNLAQPPVNFPPASEKLAETPNVLPETSAPSFHIDSFKLVKNLGLAFVLLFGVLLMIDLLVIKARGVYRLSARHLPQMLLLAVVAMALITMVPGVIL